MDTLQIRNSENKVIRDSLVLSMDKNIDRIESNELILSLLSSGGQNKVKPPEKLYFKDEKLYLINKNGSLDTRKLKDFWTDKKYKTYFIKKAE